MAHDSKSRGLKKLFLWVVAVLGGFPLNTHRRQEPVIGVFGGDVSSGEARRKALDALMHNLGLMDEAVARYLAVVSEPEIHDSVAAATALRRTYQKVRAGFIPINTAVLPAELASKAALLHEVFQEVSLLCNAADMSGLLGGTDFGAGFEHLTALYQPGANMFQPEALKLTTETCAELEDGAIHFAEVKKELIDLVEYYGGKA